MYSLVVSSGGAVSNLAHTVRDSKTSSRLGGNLKSMLNKTFSGSSSGSGSPLGVALMCHGQRVLVHTTGNARGSTTQGVSRTAANKRRRRATNSAKTFPKMVSRRYAMFATRASDASMLLLFRQRPTSPEPSCNRIHQIPCFFVRHVERSRVGAQLFK